MLIDMLLANEDFTALPEEKQDIYARLAKEFEDNELALHLTPAELSAKLQIGNKELWRTFLSFEPVQNYIKGQMAEMAQIASRKAFNALQMEAMKGDTSAAKQINELAGIYNQADQNKVVVLVQIARPKKKPPTAPPIKEEADDNH